MGENRSEKGKKSDSDGRARIVATRSCYQKEKYTVYTIITNTIYTQYTVSTAIGGRALKSDYILRL